MHVAYLLYEDVEPIDLAPLGVLSMAARIISGLSYQVVAARTGAIKLAGGLQVLADVPLDQVGAIDALIVPGGNGWVAAAADPAVLAFIRGTLRTGATIISVCTGAMILERAGVLDGLQATTKSRVANGGATPLEKLAGNAKITARRNAMVVDNGQVITGGGVTLGIDTMLYFLRREYGSAIGEKVAELMEYERAARANMSARQVVVAQARQGT